MDKKKEERLQQQVKQIAKLPHNKRCADCTEKLPQYVNLTFNTFICTACAGVHREFSHRVKSIGLSTFTVEEVKALQNGGNEVNNSIYLKKWDPRENPEPEAGNEQKVREWIRHKYIDRRWHQDSIYQTRRGSRDTPEPLVRRGSGSVRSEPADHQRRPSKGKDNIPQAQPISSVLPDVRQVEVKQTKKTGADLLDLVFAPGEPSPPSHAPPPPQTNAFPPNNGLAQPSDPFSSSWNNFGNGTSAPPFPPQQQALQPGSFFPPQQQGTGFPNYGSPSQAPGPFGADPFAQPFFPPQGQAGPAQQAPTGFPPQQAQSAYPPQQMPPYPSPPNQQGPPFPAQLPQGYPPQGQPYPPPPMPGYPAPLGGAPFPPQGYPTGPGPVPPQQWAPQNGPQVPGQSYGILPPNSVRPQQPPPPPGPPQPPKPITLSIDEAFGELAISPAPPTNLDIYAAGEEVIYTDSQGKATLALIAKIHRDDVHPYYTLRLPTGQEKQTDFHHLKKKPAPPPPPPVPNGVPLGPNGVPLGPSRQPSGPVPVQSPIDPFSNLGQQAWNGVVGGPRPPFPIDGKGPGAPVQVNNPFGTPPAFGSPSQGLSPANPFAAPVEPTNPFGDSQGGPPPTIKAPPSGNPFDMF